MVNKDFWSLLGGASATISGLAFILLAIYYSYVQSLTKEVSKLGLKGPISDLLFVKMLKCFIFFLIPLIASAVLLSNSDFSMLIFVVLIVVSMWARYLIANRRKYTEEKLKADTSDFLILVWIAFIGVLTYIESRYDSTHVAHVSPLEFFTLLSFLIGIS